MSDMRTVLKISPMPGFMEELKPGEVSHVRKPASRREYLLLKSQENVMDELINAAAAVELENEAELAKSLKDSGVSDKGIEVVKTLARLLTAYSDEVDVATVAKSLGLPTEAATEEETGVRKEDIEALPEALREKFASLVTENEAAAQRLLAVEGALEKSAEKARERVWTEKTAGLDSIGVEQANLVATLKRIEEVVDADAANELLDALRSANSVAKSAETAEGDSVFKSFGSGNSGEGSDDPVYELSKKAVELRKENPELTEGKAMTQVLDANPELKRRYAAFNQKR